MAAEPGQMSLWDTLRLQWYVVLQTSVLGVVAPNRLGLALLTQLSAGRSVMRFLSELRERYGARPLWTWFPFRRTLLVLDAPGIEAVLGSPENAADPFLKKWALSRFVPDALVISSGQAWRERRRYNERALDTGCLHRHAAAFADVVAREVSGFAGRAELRWADFQALGERISHQVILGEGDVERAIADDLASLVKRANLGLRHHSAFGRFYAALRRHLSMPPRRGLAEERDTTPITRSESQMGFWFFVLKDAVELHTARTLALIAAHPHVQERARTEVLAAASLTAPAIDGMRYLEACVREQLRLWTPVPLLLRRAPQDFALPGGLAIPAGRQILLHAGFYHRDPRVFGAAADKFSPDAPPGAALYAFSAHHQRCAGESLVMFLLKASLAAFLARRRFELVAPAIEHARVPYLYDHFKVTLRTHG
jgi:cytochrome P450